MLKPAGRRNELAGIDFGDSIIRERHRCHTSPVEYPAVSVKVEVQVVKAVRPAVVGQVSHRNRVQVEKEMRLGISRGARLLNVGQRVVPELYVKGGADAGCSTAGIPRRINAMASWYACPSR